MLSSRSAGPRRFDSTEKADDDQRAGGGLVMDQTTLGGVFQNLMMSVILQRSQGAVHFDLFSISEENSFAFFWRPWRAGLQHLMSTLGLMPTQREQDEAAF